MKFPFLSLGKYECIFGLGHDWVNPFVLSSFSGNNSLFVSRLLMDFYGL